MATEVVMPQMGESIAEGTITKWLVKTGDKVERDQPLFEISTDKVDAEIPSPASGVLLEIRAQEGQTVEVNAVVALIGAADGAAAAAPAASPEAAAPAAPAPATAVASTAAPAAERPTDEAERLRTFSSPLVRKIAQDEGVDLARVEGTGVHGRVTKKDIETFLEKRGAAPAPAAAGPRPVPGPTPGPGPGPTPTPGPRPTPQPGPIPVPGPTPGPGPFPTPDPTSSLVAKAAPAGFWVPAFREGEDVEIEPMSKIREITAAHMRYSKDTSAHVTTVFSIDMTRVDRIRARAKDGFFAANGTKLSYMPFIFKAVAAALKKHRKLNAALDGTSVVFKKHVNLGMAVALDWGLLVPVIRDADQLSLVGLAKTANDLADRARAKKLGPDELKGGTFTITNPGVFGSLFGTPIINQPQVAILGIGTIEKRPVVVTGPDGSDMIGIRTMSYFGITYDHRLVDGADADHFMNDVKKMLETDSWGELDSYRGA